MEPLLELPTDLRSELKKPLGPVYQDADALLADAGEPLVAVGDVVTYHLLEAGYRPAVALVDGKTKRERVRREVRETVGDDGFDHRLEVASPAGGLSEPLLATLRKVIDAGKPTLVEVTGEEDLAALPAVLALPAGASVVYGQPDEGMVLAMVDERTRTRVKELLDGFEGDHATAYATLGVA
ncbi:GTP-dependent dephospho-CoA kinase family protein [Halosegnis sp.]|uniref:GTP-dependent dephospho-CoA kinase family protein n=1 Tax=Halosegnis sp. TaxID=2864959 RepID=UPI0035D4A372